MVLFPWIVCLGLLQTIPNPSPTSLRIYRRMTGFWKAMDMRVPDVPSFLDGCFSNFPTYVPPFHRTSRTLGGVSGLLPSSQAKMFLWKSRETKGLWQVISPTPCPTKSTKTRGYKTPKKCGAVWSSDILRNGNNMK